MLLRHSPIAASCAVAPSYAGFVELVSDHLLLRPVSERDLDFYFEVRNGPEVLAVPGRDARPRSEVERQIRRWKELWQERGFGTWTVFSRETDERLGRVELDPMGEGWVGISPGEIEVGYIVHPTHWNRGIATEAALLAATDCSDRVALDMLVALTTVANAASLRTLEKIGMRYRGETQDPHDHTTYEVYELTRATAGVARRGSGSWLM
jgi:RimJ/RimL family protein N-acetyltransferase